MNTRVREYEDLQKKDKLYLERVFRITKTTSEGMTFAYPGYPFSDPPSKGDSVRLCNHSGFAGAYFFSSGFDPYAFYEIISVQKKDNGGCTFGIKGPPENEKTIYVTELCIKEVSYKHNPLSFEDSLLPHI